MEGHICRGLGASSGFSVLRAQSGSPLGLPQSSPYFVLLTVPRALLLPACMLPASPPLLSKQRLCPPCTEPAWLIVGGQENAH